MRDRGWTRDGAIGTMKRVTNSADLSGLAPARRRVIAISAGLVLISAVGALIPSSSISAATIGIANACMGAVGAWAAWRRGLAEPSARVGWWLLAGSLVVYAPAQFVAIAPFLGLGEATHFPNTGDLVALSFLPLAGLSMLLWRASPRGSRAPLGSIFDGLLFAVAFFFLMWDAALGAHDLADVPRPMLVCALGFFIGSSVNLGVAIHLAGRTPERWRGPLGFLIACFLLAAANGVGIVLTGLEGTYFSGHAVDVLAVSAGAVGTAGFLSPRPSLAPASDEPSPSWPAAFAPYAPLMIALVLLMVRGIIFGQRQDRVEDWLVLTLMLIIAARQFLALRDVRRLSSVLEAKVAERTKQLEDSHAALMRAQRLEALGRMSGGVAHDFNNLLTVVASSAQMIRRATPNQGTRELDNIDAAVQRASDLTHQLLAFARKQPLARRDFDVNDLLVEVEPLLLRLASSNCQVRLDLGRVCEVNADPAQIEQLVMNLVANARDALPDGGTVMISTMMLDEPELDLDLPLLPGRCVVVSVKDTGVGMSPETIERAFEPFFTTKDHGEGTGLGLATCWGIASQAGGHLRIESTPGGGTTVRAYLPGRDSPRVTVAEDVPSVSSNG